MGGVPGPSAFLLESDLLSAVGWVSWPLMVAVRPSAILVRLLRAVRRMPTRTGTVGLVLAA